MKRMKRGGFFFAKTANGRTLVARTTAPEATTATGRKQGKVSLFRLKEDCEVC